MILDGYALLAAFVALVELVLGATVAVLALSARRRRLAALRAGAPEGEARLDRAILPALLLLGTSVASWPLLYLLLDAYVPAWEGVMCIAGVTRIGAQSEGLPGWLPTLLRVLQGTKPALVFSTGVWVALHVANRRTRTAPLSGRVLLALAATGALAVADASAELAYVAIPKKEITLARGCCTTPTTTLGAEEGRPFRTFADPARARPYVVAAFFAASAAAALLAARLALRRTAPAAPGAGRALRTCLAAAATLAVGLVFLVEVGAPAFLRRPDNHCPYCLLASSPVGLFAVGLHVLGAFALGWAALVDGLAAGEETRDTLPGQVRALARTAVAGYLGAALLTGVQLAIA